LLSAGQVRDRQFPLSRHGLHRIANELTALQGELARTREENLRIKTHLRDWQSRFTPRVRV
jgi:hypothetical protein